MTQKTRIQKLLQRAGATGKARYKYLLVIAPELSKWWDSEEEQARGYKIQPCTREFGGTGEAPFYLKTWEEVEAFRARPDVDLDIIRIDYSDAGR